MNSRGRNAVLIEATEGVTFSLPLAGPVSRFVAWVIDLMVIGAACSVLGKILQPLQFLNGDMFLAIIVISFFAIWAGYGIALEWWWRGQTIGKRVLGLRVLDGRGLKLRFTQVSLRNLMRFVDALPFLYFVGGVSMMLSRRYQRLGDRIADTVVLRHKRVPPPDLSRIEIADKYNSLLDAPHLAARLRQNAGPELAQAAYEALLRRDQLTAAARIEVFHGLAARFREIVTFPDEITAPLTDERYVRNALDAVVSAGPLRRRRANSPTDHAAGKSA